MDDRAKQMIRELEERIERLERSASTVPQRAAQSTDGPRIYHARIDAPYVDETCSAYDSEVRVWPITFFDAVFPEDEGCQVLTEDERSPTVYYAASWPAATFTEGQNVEVHRRGGRWWILAGTGGESPLYVRFQVSSVEGPELRLAECFIDSIPNGLTIDDIPGRNSADPFRITVCDPSGCHFNEPSAALLLGRSGWAAWMQPLNAPIPCQDSEDGYGNPVTEFSPQWEVFTLCCGGVEGCT